MGEESGDSCLILSKLLPLYPCEVHEGYLLRAIRPSEGMLEQSECNIYNGCMALTCNDETAEFSYRLYKDLVIFHSFISDDPETYEYAEWLEHARSAKPYANSEIEFIDDLMTSDACHPCDDGLLLRECGVDFRRYPFKIIDDPQDVATGGDQFAVAVPERWTPLEGGSSFRLDDQSLYENVDYRVALGTFRGLRDIDVSLRNQIDLYVFTRSIWHTAQMYRNDYLSAAFYIAMLESIAGQPKACSNKIKCPQCRQEIGHSVTSLEKHFMKTYGKWFKELRGIRHKFFHEVAHFDFADALNDIYDASRGRKPEKEPLSRDDQKRELEYFRIKDDTDKLGKIVRKRLVELFLKHYYDALAR